MKVINAAIEKTFSSEPMCKLFKSNGLFCLIVRMNWSGNLNGYIAVPAGHALYGKSYSDSIKVDKDKIAFNGNYISLFAYALDEKSKEDEMMRLDLAIDVHGGLTYSSRSHNNIEDGVLGDVWWFGFDTAHAGDQKPFQSEIDLKYPMDGDEYRDFEYVKEQCIKLAEQLAAHA